MPLNPLLKKRIKNKNIFCDEKTFLYVFKAKLSTYLFSAFKGRGRVGGALQH
ncbi:MAG: hypothetical protein ACLVK5_04750 [Peptoniphilus senegalensis]